MECQTCFESLSAFIDGELDSREENFVQSHLDQCNQCYDQYQSFLHAHRLVDRVERLELNPALWAKIHSEIAQFQAEQTTPTWRFQPLLSLRWGPIAASAVGLILLGALSFSLISIEQRNDQLQKALYDYMEQREVQYTNFTVESPSTITRPFYPNPFRVHHHTTQENPFKSE